MPHPERPARPVIRVVAAVIIDTDGRMLLVRKRGTDMFMQPGGKPEPGESLAEALARELEEEIGATCDPRGFDYLGRFESTAANEHGHALDAEMFRVQLDGPAVAAAEIEELRWLRPDEMTGLPIAPLVYDHALAFILRAPPPSPRAGEIGDQSR